MDDCVIELRRVRVVTSQRTLLDIPEWTVRQGERVALIGPNGAGKSTLLKVLGGFMAASEGQVTVLGRSLRGQESASLSRTQWRALRAEIGQVMQGLHLVPRLTALENTVLGALARAGAMPAWRSWLRWYPLELREEARSALASLGLAHRLLDRADQLSGGERQKVSLARLQLQRPRLILADEPTSALDPAATQQACQTLLTIARKATLITVVHDAALLPQLADRVIGLRHGRIAFDMPVSEVHPSQLHALYEGENTPVSQPALP